MPSSPAIDDLEAPVAAALQREDREGDDGGHEAGGEQRDAEEQVQRDRRADELGEVGRHRDELGLDPQAPGDGAREVLAAQLGQVAAGRDADLGRQVLDQHRHQVRGEDHPQQQVAVLGAAGDVGGEVAGVDVGDAGDEGRAEQRRALPRRRPRDWQLLQRGWVREGDGLDGGGRCERRRHAATSTRIARASAPPSTWTSSPKRAKSGPSNGCLSTTSNVVAGRDPALGQVAQHLGVGVGDAHEASPRAPASSVGQRDWSGAPR